MKKILALLFLLSGSLIPLACSDNNSNPTKPPAGNPVATPTGTAFTPTFTFTPGAGTPSATPTPTFSGAIPPYVGAIPLANAPSGMYAIGGQIYVAENNPINPYIQIFNETAPWALAGFTNFMVVGITAPQTVFLKGPQGFTVTTDPSGPTSFYIVLDDDPNSTKAVMFDGLGLGSAPVTGFSYGIRPLSSPKGFSGDGLGNYYVGDTGNGYVEEFVANSAPAPGTFHEWKGFWNGASTVSFRQPNAIAVDPSGNVYVADSGYSPTIIAEMTSSGVTFISDFNTVPGCVAQGIAVAASGNVYVSDSALNQVEEYSPTGTIIREWGIPLSFYQPFPFTPAGIILDTVNNQILVGDDSTALIDVFSPAAPF